MSKVKVKSLKVIKQYLLWASSSAVIFIALLCLLVACNPNRYSTSPEQQTTPPADARQNKQAIVKDVPPPPDVKFNQRTDPNELPAEIIEIPDDVEFDIELDISITEQGDMEELVFEEAPAEVFLFVEPEANDFNTEEYDRIYENSFQAVWQQPVSTFSIDVDKAAYSNVRRYLTQYHQLPPKDAVRIEEMINYFHYDYLQPEGAHPFALTTEMGACPWNPQTQLLHIGIQGKSLDYELLQPSNLVLLLDVSGSMDEPNKLPLVKKSIRLLVENLTEQDRVAMVVYAGAAGLVLPSTPAHQQEKIWKAIEKLEAGGSTAGGEGIALAYQIAQENLIPGGNNRVILATDGDFNIGTSSTGELVRMIEEKRKAGIYLTICGFGMGNYKDGRMEQISNAGNGNYFYIDNIKEAEKVFVREMRANLFTIAKDVKLQLEFNPHHVKAYRLIGYENRMMANEDFDDDQKDAGELGAGHTVTALYELMPAESDLQASTHTALRYQQSTPTPLAHTDELLTLKLRYKPIDSDESLLMEHRLAQQALSQPSNNLRFASAVAGFGMLLRDSQYKGNLSFQEVLQLAQGASDAQDEEKHEFIQLIKTASLLNR
ncbi:vWA domain-containing protein [Catalinimonas niigatensis]|uniref:vWA domain-containing protein n=1 Tax=Catalinimonas niigatensis TaxID=1397264 RepID=UPI002665AFDE|nr:VWA domain-containing protein [Catalinimonas niigatensis]WPP53044.1 VWA domain-containing protein [Catalinimonas niigatensis]